jgi:tetratricopeptide (TPR) repeat protein
MRQGDPEAGIPYLERAAALQASDSVLVDLGSAYMAAGSTPRAIEAFERAVRVGRNHGDALRFLGHLLTTSGRAAEAIPYLQSAVTHQPGSALTHAFLAEAYAATRAAEPAASAAATAARLADGDPVVLRIAGRSMLDLGRFEDADRYLSAAGQAAQQDPGVLTELGYAREARGRTRQAEALYMRAIELAPDYKPARDALARLRAR